jgi:hypothetical protein
MDGSRKWTRQSGNWRPLHGAGCLHWPGSLGWVLAGFRCLLVYRNASCFRQAGLNLIQPQQRSDPVDLGDRGSAVAACWADPTAEEAVLRDVNLLVQEQVERVGNPEPGGIHLPSGSACRFPKQARMQRDDWATTRPGEPQTAAVWRERPLNPGGRQTPVEVVRPGWLPWSRKPSRSEARETWGASSVGLVPDRYPMPDSRPSQNSYGRPRNEWPGRMTSRKSLTRPSGPSMRWRERHTISAPSRVTKLSRSKVRRIAAG